MPRRYKSKKNPKAFHLYFQGEKWNPFHGCDDVSEGCGNCYARRMARWQKRLHRKRRHPKYQTDGICNRFVLPPDKPGATAPGFGLELHWDEARYAADHTNKRISRVVNGKRLSLPPLAELCDHTKTQRRVFVGDMSDLFHKDIPDDFIRLVFQGTQHPSPRRAENQYLILTKRPTRMAKLWPKILAGQTPPENLWMGVSVESNKYVHRADYLRQTPAHIRWISVEPFLGPVHKLDLTNIDWVVSGGESEDRGQLARPLQVAWVRELRDKCKQHNVAFMFKQWGNPRNTQDKTDARNIGDPNGGCVLDGQVHHEFP